MMGCGSMMVGQTFGWTDIEEIALALEEAHPRVDPVQVRFTQLRQMVEQLPDFDPEPGQTVNEQILEAIQAAWIDEREDVQRDEDDPGYKPNDPFR